MNRDATVVTVRAAMKKIVGLASERGSGLMFRQPSGELDVWNIWDNNSYRSTALRRR